MRWAQPRWLVERWIREYGSNAAQQICRHNQTIPTTSIRLRTARAESELNSEKIQLLPGSFLSTARRVQAGDITKIDACHRGEIVIQDEASQLVAALVGHGEHILDCCAAPGGKTLAMADANPESTIMAVELHPHRARLLRKLVSAGSSKKIKTVVADATALPLSQTFDRVLADVPCSGTGTLARNPEIKWRLKPEDLTDLHARQLAILRSALGQVRTGGRIVYSTCSLEREENEDVVDEALTENKFFHVVDCAVELEHLKTAGELTWPDPASLLNGPYLRTIPGVHPCDGFFAAILEKRLIP